MDLPIPRYFDQVADEIVRFAGLDPADVAERLDHEFKECGWNVARDAERLGVTPYLHCPAMERLYRESDGFIFETLTFWTIPLRQSWTEHAAARIERYLEQRSLKPEQARILILGDGTGNDSLFLINRGLNLHYFDFPGSRTYDFATRRFEHHGLIGSRLTLMTSLAECLARRFDVVLSFEVLEHLTDPQKALHDIATMLKPKGIALLTDSFGDVRPQVPTHLISNLDYAGRTPFMALKAGLHLNWFNRESMLKPSEYVKDRRPRWLSRLSMIYDPDLRRHRAHCAQSARITLAELGS